MRRFALSNLKDFGMGRRACEDKIIEECHHLMEELKKFRGDYRSPCVNEPFRGEAANLDVSRFARCR